MLLKSTQVEIILSDTADFKIDTDGKVYITGGLEVTGEVISSTNTVIRDSLIELNNNTTEKIQVIVVLLLKEEP